MHATKNQFQKENLHLSDQLSAIPFATPSNCRVP